MIFDLQLFATVTIDDEAVNNGAVVGQGADVAYTITTIAAQAKIDVESQSDEVKEAIANGTTGTVVVNGESIEVSIANDGTVTRNDGGNVDDVIGQVVQFVAGGGSTITANVNSVRAIYATSNNSTISEDTVISGIFAEGDDGALDTTNPYSVTISGGVVTAISNNEGAVDLEELDALTLSTNPDETIDTGSANASTQTTYSGDLTAGGVSFTVNVDANGSASYTANGSALSGNTYVQSDVTVGSYTVTEQALVAGKLTGTGSAPAINVSSAAGTASATFANGVVANLNASDTSKVISFTVNGTEQTDTSKVTVGDLVYTYATNGTSGTLTVDATSIPSYAVGIESGTGVDNATFTAKVGKYTLNYAVASRDAKSSDTVNATLVSVTDNASGTYTVNAANGTFTDADGNIFTATTTVASTYEMSGNVQAAGGITTTEKFVATSGKNTATFGSDFGDKVIDVTSTDGTTWAIAQENSTVVSANGLDTLTVNVDESGKVVATADHGLTNVDSATYIAKVEATSAGDSVKYTIGTATLDVTYTDDKTYVIENANGFDSSTSSTVTLGGVTYTFAKNADSQVYAVASTIADQTVKATEVLGAVNGTIKAGTGVKVDYDGDGKDDFILYTDAKGAISSETVLDVTATGTVAAPDGLTFKDGAYVYNDVSYNVEIGASGTSLVASKVLTSYATVATVDAKLGADTLKINLGGDLGVDTADSDVTLKVEYDSNSEITSAQLVGDGGTTYDVTVGQLGTYTFGSKDFQFTLSSNALEDNDLTGEDVVLKATKEHVSEPFTAKNSGANIKFQYDCDTTFVLTVTDDTKKVLKVSRIDGGTVSFSTSYEAKGGVGTFDLGGDGGKGYFAPVVTTSKDDEPKYTIKFDSAGAPKLLAYRGTIEAPTVSNSSAGGFAITSDFSFALAAFGTAQSKTSGVFNTAFLFAGENGTFGTVLTKTPFSNKGYNTLDVADSNFLGTAFHAFGTAALPYGSFGFKLSSAVTGGKKDLEFTFKIDTKAYNTETFATTGNFDFTFKSPTSINSGAEPAITSLFSTNFMSVYGTNNLYGGTHGGLVAAFGTAGSNALENLKNVGILGTSNVENGSPAFTIFGTSQAFLYDSNGFGSANQDGDFTLALDGENLRIFAGKDDAVKTTYDLKGTTFGSAIGNLLTAFGTLGALSKGTFDAMAFGTAMGMAFGTTKDQTTNGLFASLTTGSKNLSTSITIEKKASAIFGAEATAKLGSTSYLGTHYFSSKDKDTIYGFDVDNDGEYDFYKVGTGKSYVYDDYYAEDSINIYDSEGNKLDKADAKKMFGDMGNYDFSITSNLTTQFATSYPETYSAGVKQIGTNVEEIIGYQVSLGTAYTITVGTQETSANTLFSTNALGTNSLGTAYIAAAVDGNNKFVFNNDKKDGFAIVEFSDTEWYKFSFSMGSDGKNIVLNDVYLGTDEQHASDTNIALVEGEGKDYRLNTREVSVGGDPNEFYIGTSTNKYTLSLSSAGELTFALTLTDANATFGSGSTSIFETETTTAASGPRATYTLTDGLTFETDTSASGTFSTSVGDVTYTLKFSSGGVIDSYTTSTTKTIATVAIEAKDSREPSTYFFSDTKAGYTFNVDVASDLSINAATINGSAVELTKDGSTVSYTDAAKNLTFSAKVKDAGVKGVLDGEDSVTISIANGKLATETAVYSAGGAEVPAYYSDTLTIDGTVYGVKTADTSTGSALTFTKGTETLSAIEGYTVNFVDDDTVAGNNNEYFTYYSASGVTLEATMGDATVEGTVGDGNGQVKVTKVGTTYTLQTGTAADGTTYQFIDGSEGDFKATTGASGSTVEFTANDVKAEVTRTISGGQIAGVDVTLYESGTSVNDLVLYAASGTGVALATDGKSITVGDITYQISGEKSNYAAKADASEYNLTSSSEILVVPTTYTFSANGTDYVVAVQDGTVKSYANNEYGDPVGDITVRGDIIYTINYDSASHSASVEGTINGQTYATSPSVDLASATDLYLDIRGQRIFADAFNEAGTYTTQYGGTRYVYTWDGESTTASYYTTAEASIYEITADDEQGTITTLVDEAGNVVSSDVTYTARWLSADGETYVTAAGTVAKIAELAADNIADGASISLVSDGKTLSVDVAGDKSLSYVQGNNSSTTAPIVNDVATLSGVTLSFVAGEDGTYTTVNGVSITGDSFTIAGSNDATLAVLGEDGVWTIDDTNIDNIENTTAEPIAIRANGDEGTLAAGAAYNPDTNELVKAGDGKSAIKNEDGYTTTDGKVTGLTEDGTVAYDANGNMIITGATEETKIGDNTIPVTGDDNYNVTMNGSEVAALDGISDGATVNATNIPVGMDDGATATFLGDGEVTINGSAVGQAGDADGIAITAAEDGVSAISDVDAGASVTAGDGVAIATDAQSGTFVVNSLPLTTDDITGITVTPIGDGYQIEGLDEGAVLQTTSEAEVPVTVGSGDNALTTALSSKNSVIGAAEGQTPTTYDTNDQSIDQTAEKLGIDVSQLEKKTVTADDIVDGVLDLSDSGSSLIRLGKDVPAGTTVVLPEAGGSIVQIDDGAEGEFTFEGSDNGDSFINNSPNAIMNAKGGAGNDYFKTASKEDKIDLANGGADTLDIMENGGTLENYDPTAENAPAILTDASDQDVLIEAIKNGNLEFGDNSVGDVSMNDLADDDRTLAKFMSEDGTSKLYAWTGEDGGKLNGTDLPEGSVLVGNAGGSHSGSNITAGANQTAIAGEGDVVAAGTGSTIEMTHNGDGAGAQIDAENSTGTVEVNGFTGGFSGKHNGFRKNRSTKPGLSLLNGLLTFLIGGLTAVLNANDSAAFIEKNDGSSDTLLIATNTADYTDPATGVLETSFTDEDGNAENYVMIGDEKEYKVSDESLTLNFVGTGSSKGSGVSFDNLTDVDVDLNDTTQYSFSDVASVQAAAGESSLVATDNNTMGLVAGSGKTTVIGGAADDTIYGYEGSSETTIIFGSGSGNDVIKNFSYGSEGESDKFEFGATALTGAQFDGNDLKITVDGGDVLTITNAQGNKIKANAEVMGFNGIVEFGTSLTYDEKVDMYGNYNTTQNKMTVADSDVTENVAIYMNGQDSTGKTFDEKYYYNVNEVDASALTKDASIAGYDNLDDTIKGGQGSNSLWGGLGGNDLLVGGEGQNTFFYLNGDGNDTVQANSGDTIELWNTNLSDLDLNSIAENSNAKSIAVKFNNGNTLTVTGSDLTGVGFKIGQASDADVWSINKDKTWSKKEDKE